MHPVNMALALTLVLCSPSFFYILTLSLTLSVTVSLSFLLFLPPWNLMLDWKLKSTHLHFHFTARSRTNVWPGDLFHPVHLWGSPICQDVCLKEDREDAPSAPAESDQPSVQGEILWRQVLAGSNPAGNFWCTRRGDGRKSHSSLWYPVESFIMRPKIIINCEKRAGYSPFLTFFCLSMAQWFE